MTDFQDQVAIVTGASGLLASGVVPILKQRGAKLVLTSADDRFGERFPGWEADANCLFLPHVDLADEAAAASVAKAALERFGRIDILVNIAGGWDAGQPVGEMRLTTWETMLRLNATTAFLMSRAVIPGLVAGGGGSIINIGARPGTRSSGNDAAYAASKAALLRLTESLSEEYKGLGIRANAIMPSAIVPEDAYAADPASGVTPKQLGEVIAFLASDAGRIIRGAIIPAYGAKF